MDYENIEAIQLNGSECYSCGNIDFYIEQGNYYCGRCHTQSAGGERQLDTNDEIFSGAATRNVQILRDEQTTKKPKETKRDLVLTSWELHNYALRIIVDRLIELGFPPVFRDKVFQLWIAYLIKRQAVFISPTDVNAKYPVTANEKAANLEVFYSFKKPRKPPLKRKKAEEPSLKQDLAVGVENLISVSQEKKRRTTARRKAIEKGYIEHASQMSQMDSAYDEFSIKSLLSKDNTKEAVEKEKPKFKLTDATVKLNKALREEDIAYADMLNKDVLMPERFNLRTMYVIVFIALRQVGCRILFTDLLRLILDGTLYMSSLRLVLSGELSEQLTTASELELEFTFAELQNLTNSAISITSILDYLGIKKFRYATVKEFLPKFMDDFALPREMECLVYQIDKMMPIEENLVIRKVLESEILKPIIELYIISLITTVLKLLFGLDDVTEKYQSKFAIILETVLEKQASEQPRTGKNSEWVEPFVLEDWFKYLRHREELIELELYSHVMKPPLKAPNLNRLNCLVEQFGGQKGINTATSLKNRDMFHSFSEQALEGNDDEIAPVITYTTVQLPKESVVHQFFQKNPSVSYPDLARDFKYKNFEKCRIDFIFNPEKYIPLLKEAGYGVEVMKGDARKYQPSSDKNELDLVLFQPFKAFDDFVAPEKLSSASLNFIFNLGESVLTGRGKTNSATRKLLERLTYEIGVSISKNSVTGLVPIYPYSDSDDSDSDSDDSDSDSDMSNKSKETDVDDISDDDSI